MLRVAFSLGCAGLLAVAVVAVGPGPVSDPGHASVPGPERSSTLDKPDPETRRKIFGALGRLPLYFVENQDNPILPPRDRRAADGSGLGLRRRIRLSIARVLLCVLNESAVWQSKLQQAV